MKKPLVVIVGRPNVGKSTLFNRMTGTQDAIVEDLPGVTRDRNYRDVEWGGKQFMVVDTGGFTVDPLEDIFAQAKEQALFAIDEADLIVQLMDGRDGLMPADLELARLLRESGKRVIWAVNKVDAPGREERTYDFYRIGADELMPVSAATGYGFDEFMDRLASFLPEYCEEPADYPKIAVVGRPNVGKSTLVNALTGKDRMVVSPQAGTTVDAIDTVCTYYGRPYLIIDTAGIRRKGKVGYSVERFSMVRAIRSIERCDVAVVVLDASEGITEQDIKIAGIVKEYGRGAIILINKWDLIKEPEQMYKAVTADLGRKLWFAPYAPVLTASGLEKRRITKVFPVVDRIIAARRLRVPTAELNRFFREKIEQLSIPMHKGRTVKLYYLTQVKGEPPAFVIFANHRDAVREPLLRYVEKELRGRFGFEGTPIRMYVRERSRRGSP
ncbi:MAG: ribosome biogenesis GTPase Der [Thermodesulfovibrionales bacterium]